MSKGSFGSEGPHNLKKKKVKSAHFVTILVT